MSRASIGDVPKRAEDAMKPAAKPARGPCPLTSTLRLWLVFLAFAGAAAMLLWLLQRVDIAFSRSAPPIAAGAARAVNTLNALNALNAASATRERPPMPRMAFAPTFADAAQSMRAGRHAEAYGRFVMLADEGDVDAARMALVMHRFGSEVFASAWDASTEQLAAWTWASQQATARELADGRAAASPRR